MLTYHKSLEVEGSTLFTKHFRLLPVGVEVDGRLTEYHLSFGKSWRIKAFQKNGVVRFDARTELAGLSINPTWDNRTVQKSYRGIYNSVNHNLEISEVGRLWYFGGSRKTGWSDLFAIGVRTVTGISLVVICCGSLRDVSLECYLGSWNWRYLLLSRSRALTMSFNSQQHREYNQGSG
ncbi:hypothetical protein Tco_0527563 [Tanacetum coccineum]